MAEGEKHSGGQGGTEKEMRRQGDNAVHTEVKAVTDMNIPAGENINLQMEGTRPPCESSKGYMNFHHRETGTQSSYTWVDKNGERQNWISTGKPIPLSRDKPPK